MHSNGPSFDLNEAIQNTEPFYWQFIRPFPKI